MITSRLELIQQTKAKFARATGLAKPEHPTVHEPLCVYAHDANQVGCAIGCHLPSWQARQWDQLELNGITHIYRRQPDEVQEYFDVDAIDIDYLDDLQRAHDEAHTLAEFLSWLDAEEEGLLSQAAAEGTGVATRKEEA